MSGLFDMKRSQALTALLAVLAALMAVSFGANAESSYHELRAAIEKNWLIPVGLDNVDSCTVTLRLHLAADGAVSKIEPLEENGDPDCSTVAESARRAILITQNELGRLPIPADKYNSTIDVRWPMKLICEQQGGC